MRLGCGRRGLKLFVWPELRDGWESILLKSKNECSSSWMKRGRNTHFVVDNAMKTTCCAKCSTCTTNWSVSMPMTAKRLNFRSMVWEAANLDVVGIGLMVLGYSCRIRLGVSVW